MSDSHPILTVDTALFTLRNGRLCLAVQSRDHAPFAGAPALIGGYVRPASDADTTASAARILADKAGLENVFLEQLMSFSGPDRDPRGWSVSIAHYALVPDAILAAAHGRVGGVTVLPVDSLPPLAFDHDRIVAAALARLRGKSAWSTLPALLLPELFTLPELKAVYETVMGAPLNDSAFRRKIGELRILEPVEAKTAATAETRRPAQLYRLARRGLTAFDRMM